MKANHQVTQGGVHVSATGGGIVNVSGVVVGRDINQRTTTHHRFASEEQKQEFQTQIDLLRETLRALKTSIDQHASLSTDDKEAMAAEILKQLGSLKDIKEKTSVLDPGKEASSEIKTAVESTLDHAGRISEKLKTVGDNAGAITDTILKYAEKLVPLIASARHLFGFP